MFIFRLLFMVGLIVCLPVSSAYSQVFIKDSYIITFRDDAGVIDPPNPANAGKVPVGQPTSGQSKEELTVTLGLNGEIVAILEVSNGIVVKMDAQEAKRWQQDERVLHIDQDMEVSSTVMNEPQSDYPVYRDGILTIPRVDTDKQAGNYQKAELQFDSTTNTWKLLNFIESKVNPGPATYQEKVEAIITGSSPVQVFLKISGEFSNGCEYFQQINQILKNNKFEITLHLGPNPFPPGIACTAALVPYEKIIPLKVYGLPAGTYEYSVNGEHTGSFTLTKDNTL